MEDIYIESLMTHNVVTVSSDTEIKHVIKSMRDNNYSCMLIAEKDIPIGILTERDIVQIIANHDDLAHVLSCQAAEFMSSPLSL